MRHIIKVTDIPLWGHRFTFQSKGLEVEAILIRVGTEIRAFKNECRHLPMRLDERDPFDIWDSSGEHLACSSHGALYRATDGYCFAGPCRGTSLETVPVVVTDGSVYFEDR